MIAAEDLSLSLARARVQGDVPLTIGARLNIANIDHSCYSHQKSPSTKLPHAIPTRLPASLPHSDNGKSSTAAGSKLVPQEPSDTSRVCYLDIWLDGGSELYYAEARAL